MINVHVILSKAYSTKHCLVSIYFYIKKNVKEVSFLITRKGAKGSNGHHRTSPLKPTLVRLFYILRLNLKREKLENIFPPIFEGKV